MARHVEGEGNGDSGGCGYDLEVAVNVVGGVAVGVDFVGAAGADYGE